MATEIDAGRDRHPDGFEQIAAERLAVGGEARAVRVDEEASGRCHRDPEAELAQCRHQEIAAVAEGGAALLEQRQGRRQEARERGALRNGRRRDVEVLRELLEIADVALRCDDPPQPPPGHVEVLGEARHDEQIVGVRAGDRERRSRLAGVAQPEVDLVDDETPAQPGDGLRDPRELVRRDLRAGRIGRRGDQHAACPPGPRALDQAGGELIAGLGSDRDAYGRPLEHADEMPVARVSGVGEQDLLVAIDEQPHHQQ